MYNVNVFEAKKGLEGVIKKYFIFHYFEVLENILSLTTSSITQ